MNSIIKQLFASLVFAASFSTTISAQTTNQSTDCKCTYPYKPSCAVHCTKLLLQTDKFKATMVKSRVPDSTRTKLENWSKNTDGNQSLASILTRKEMNKFDATLQNYLSDPANREMSTSRFMHSFGGTVSILFGKEKSPYSSSNFSMSQTNLCYFPRINVSQAENTSFSIGAPVGVGVGIASNTFTDDAGVVFAFDLPLVADYNFGCKATKNTLKNFGGYVGAGFGLYHVNISQSAYSDFSGTTYGPMARAGLRFSREQWNGVGLTIGVFYKKGMEDQKLQTIGFNVLADF